MDGLLRGALGQQLSPGQSVRVCCHQCVTLSWDRGLGGRPSAHHPHIPLRGSASCRSPGEPGVGREVPGPGPALALAHSWI